jgi:hypothetical protein
MESNHRLPVVSQASSPLDHGTNIVATLCVPFPPTECAGYFVDPPGIAPGFPACGIGVFLLDDEPSCQ